MKRIKYYLKNDLIKLLFILCGGKFYLDYILITNPTSKNILIKYIYGYFKDVFTAFKYEQRYYFAYIFITIHLIFCILNFMGGFVFSITNILVNIYPIIVNSYIGYKCYKVKKFKEYENC